MDISYARTWLLATWEIIAASGLWLLIGFFAAGLLHVLLPPDFLKRHLSKPGPWSVFKASAFGIPIPLCSCSVIPVGVSLRRHGASKGSTASFFVSTPEIGVDSFLLSYVLLGPLLALWRVGASFVSAMLAGVLIDKFCPEDLPAEQEADDKQNGASCCHCGSAESEPESDSANEPSKFFAAIRFAFVDLVDDLALLLVLGFLIAGATAAIIPADMFRSMALGELGSVLMMLLVSLPLYVCATSSTPFAAVLLAKGLSPAAVLVFLLAGPATNMATIVAIKGALGWRPLVLYLCAIIGVALSAAWLISLLPSGVKTAFSAVDLLSHSAAHLSVLDQISALVLCLLLALGLLRRLKS